MGKRRLRLIDGGKNMVSTGTSSLALVARSEIRGEGRNG